MLGFGALFGLVTQHAVGSQKHKTAVVARATGASRSASAFFDAGGPGYSFDDSGARAAQQIQSSGGAQQPVAQTSAS